MKRKILAVLLAAIMTLTLFASCSEGTAPDSTSAPDTSGDASTDTSTPATEDLPINLLGNEVETIDDMPDWTGEKLELSIWVAHGTNAQEIGKSAVDDIFRAELERVTGITLSEDESFDNNGETPDTSIAKMVATDSWPDIAININSNLLVDMYESDLIYDLTEVIPEYAPNYMKIINIDETLVAQLESKKINGLQLRWSSIGNGQWMTHTDEYAENPAAYAQVVPTQRSRDIIYVRDDITQALYPDSYTKAEIEQIYVDNGFYTEEDMTDITITSPEEFRTLLEEIKALGLTEGNKEVFPFYTHDGGDNFNLLANLSSLYGGGADTNTDYFMNYDPVERKFVAAYEQEWFKEQMKFFTELVQDGLASKEALIDNNTVFTQKKNNGEYAIVYGYSGVPSKDSLEAGSKDYDYRPVLIDIPMDDQQFAATTNSGGVGGWEYTIFKNDKVTEDVLIRLVQFIDFFYSEAGKQFTNWAPESAGMYTTLDDGTHIYTDETFASEMMYKTTPDKAFEYGYGSFPSLDYFAFRQNEYSPHLIGDTSARQPDAYSTSYNYGLIEPIDPQYPSLTRDRKIWSWSGEVAGIGTFWDARQAYEDAVKKVFTAENDAEFEAFFAEMVDVAKSNGLTEEALAEATTLFHEANGEEAINALSWAIK